jgi:hypothetical protein
MPATALKEPEPEPEIRSSLRRFALPDLDTHGAWILARLKNAYPNLTDRNILGWIRTLLYDNANLFLYQDHGVALFQLTSVYSLAPKPVIIERFVFVMEGYAKEGAEFYAEAARWAKPQGIEKIFVEEMSDVPHDLIRDKIGRIFNQQQQFVRV